MDMKLELDMMIDYTAREIFSVHMCTIQIPLKVGGQRHLKAQSTERTYRPLCLPQQLSIQWQSHAVRCIQNNKQICSVFDCGQSEGNIGFRGKVNKGQQLQLPPSRISLACSASHEAESGWIYWLNILAEYMKWRSSEVKWSPVKSFNSFQFAI